MKCKVKYQRAAVLIEFAIIFPVFLLLLFFLYWLGLLLHCRESLYSAVTHGVQTAKLRADYSEIQKQSDSLTKKGLLPFIDSYIETGVWPKRLTYLLGSEDLVEEGVAVEEILQGFLNAECEERKVTGTKKSYVACFYPRAKLSDLPRESLYALVLIANDLKRSLGKMVRMPCDLANSQKELDRDPESCLKCTFLPLAEMGLSFCDQDPSSCSSLINDLGLPFDRFGIECSYRLPTFILMPLFKLLDLGNIENGLVLKAKEWVYLESSAFCHDSPNHPECIR